MIRSLELEGKSISDVIHFIKICSGDLLEGQLEKFVAEFLTEPKPDKIVRTVGEVDRNTNSEKYFMLWHNYDKTKLFCGTAFVSNEEVVRGINLLNYEV